MNGLQSSSPVSLPRPGALPSAPGLPGPLAAGTRSEPGAARPSSSVKQEHRMLTWDPCPDFDPGPWSGAGEVEAHALLFLAGARAPLGSETQHSVSPLYVWPPENVDLPM